MELKRLKEIIEEVCPGIDLSHVTEETALSDIGLDSLDLAAVIFAIESELDIEVDASKIEEIATLSDALKAIEEA